MMCCGSCAAAVVRAQDQRLRECSGAGGTEVIDFTSALDSSITWRCVPRGLHVLLGKSMQRAARTASSNRYAAPALAAMDTQRRRDST